MDVDNFNGLGCQTYDIRKHQQLLEIQPVKESNILSCSNVEDRKINTKNEMRIGSKNKMDIREWDNVGLGTTNGKEILVTVVRMEK